MPRTSQAPSNKPPGQQPDGAPEQHPTLRPSQELPGEEPATSAYTAQEVDLIRRTAWHYLNICPRCGLSLHAMQQFIAHAYQPTDDELLCLSNAMRVFR
jgi:hypothetical protein